MSHAIRTSLFTLALGLAALALAQPAQAGDFSAFAEDENICRQAGADAIKGATGPEAAHRYDVAHWRCMAAHGQARQMGAYRSGPPGPGGFTRGADNDQFPDAYYSIPYATPGYGYDGFSY